MSFSHVQSAVLIAVLPLCLVVQAEPVHLACDDAQVTFDEAKRVASYQDNDPSEASFTETGISWSGTYHSGRYDEPSDFYLDRVTGVLTFRSTGPHGGVVTHRANCSVAQKKF